MIRDVVCDNMKRRIKVNLHVFSFYIAALLKLQDYALALKKSRPPWKTPQMRNKKPWKSHKSFGYIL